MRICDPFREAGWAFLVAEGHFELQCTCGVKQRADALLTRVSGDVTLYECAHCAATLIGVVADDRVPVAGAVAAIAPTDDDGHFMCGFVFASTVDLTIWPPGADEAYMDIPARPRFFSARGCA